MPMRHKSKDYVVDLLSLADVKINGQRPWDIQVHNDTLYSRVLSGGSLALGESYMDGWWDFESLDQPWQIVLAKKGVPGGCKSVR